MNHASTHPLRHLIAWLIFALALLIARRAGAIDGGHMDAVKNETAETLFDAFIAPLYHLADESDQSVVTAFRNPLPGFEKKVRFAVVMYLDRAAAEAEAKAASQRDGREYVLKVTTLARVLKHLYVTKDEPPSEDYREPDLLVVEDRSMRPVEAEYLVEERTDAPFKVTLGRFQYTPVFFSAAEAADYEAGLERHTGKTFARVSLGVEALFAFMEQHINTAAEVRVFGYGGPALVRDYHRSVHARVGTAVEQADTSRARLIRGSDPADNDRLKRRRSGAAVP